MATDSPSPSGTSGPAKVRAAQAAQHFGISKSFLYKLARENPAIQPVRVGSRASLWDMAALADFFSRSHLEAPNV